MGLPDPISDFLLSLTEINVAWSTGVREMQRFGGNDIAAMIRDVIEDRPTLEAPDAPDPACVP